MSNHWIRVAFQKAASLDDQDTQSESVVSEWIRPDAVRKLSGEQLLQEVKAVQNTSATCRLCVFESMQQFRLNFLQKICSKQRNSVTCSRIQISLPKSMETWHTDGRSWKLEMSNFSMVAGCAPGLHRSLSCIGAKTCRTMHSGSIPSSSGQSQLLCQYRTVG